MLCTPDLARINCHVHPAADRSCHLRADLCRPHTSFTISNRGESDRYVDGCERSCVVGEAAPSQCILIPLIKVFPNLESEDSREEARRGENGTVNGIGKISRQCPREVYSIGNFGKINFVLKRFEESEDLGKKDYGYRSRSKENIPWNLRIREWN